MFLLSELHFYVHHPKKVIIYDNYYLTRGDRCILRHLDSARLFYPPLKISPSAMDLIVDKTLINPSFEGYKLGATSLQVNSFSLPFPVAQVNPDEKNYFYLRIHEETAINHLTVRPASDCNLDSSSFYYIDDHFNIQQVTHGEGKSSSNCIFTIPKPEEIMSDTVTPTLTNLSPDYVAISDGSGHLYLVKTSEIHKDKKENFSPQRDHMISLGYPFYIYQAVIKDGYAHCLLLSLHKDENLTDFHIIIDWIMLNLDHKAKGMSEKLWTSKRFKGFKSPFYLSFSPNLEALIVISNQEFVLLNGDEAESSVGNGQSKPVYYWSQSSDLVSVKFKLHEPVEKSDVYCHLTQSAIDLYLHGNTLLKGKLANEVISDASRWIFGNNELEVILVKKASGEVWSSVVLGDTRGQHNLEEEDEGKVNKLQQRLQHYTSEEIISDGRHPREPTFNMQQLEECDENLEDDLKVFCIDVNKGSQINEINLTGGQWLFNSNGSDSNSMPVCLRHDVDGILWQPNVLPHGKTISWAHVASFNALGYIQASKTEHKYTVAGRNHDFFAISDCDRRIFVYVQGEIKSKSGTQYVVTLPQQESILGLRASHNHVFVLTTTQFYSVKVI